LFNGEVGRLLRILAIVTGCALHKAGVRHTTPALLLAALLLNSALLSTRELVFERLAAFSKRDGSHGLFSAEPDFIILRAIPGATPIPSASPHPVNTWSYGRGDTQCVIGIASRISQDCVAITATGSIDDKQQERKLTNSRKSQIPVIGYDESKPVRITGVVAEAKESRAGNIYLSIGDTLEDYRVGVAAAIIEIHITIGAVRLTLQGTEHGSDFLVRRRFFLTNMHSGLFWIRLN